MHTSDNDLRQSVAQLARELQKTRAEVVLLRRYRRLSPAAALTACAGVVWALNAPAVTAQSATSPSRLVAPFTIEDDKGQELVSVTSVNGFARMRVGAQGGSVWLGTGASHSGFVAVQRQDDTNAVAIGQLGGSGAVGVHVLDASGNTSIAELTARGPNGSLSLSRAGGSKFLEGMIDQNGNGVLHAGDRGGVRLGVGLSGNGFVNTLRPDRSFAVAIGSYEGAAPGVRVFDAKGSVVLSELSGDAAGGKLIVGSVPPAQPVLKVAPTVAITDAFVTIGRGSVGHIIRVTDADGSAIATMGEARVGGGVFVAADGNGKTRMLMSGQGELHAVDPGGVTRATVTSEGALSVRNSDNTTIVKLSGSSAGNGVFELADSSGNAMVEAGILPTSEGVVRAYPLGGPPGTMLGMPGTILKGWRGEGQ